MKVYIVYEQGEPYHYGIYSSYDLAHLKTLSLVKKYPSMDSFLSIDEYNLDPTDV